MAAVPAPDGCPWRQLGQQGLGLGTGVASLHVQGEPRWWRDRDRLRATPHRWLPGGTWGAAKGEMGLSKLSSWVLLWRNFPEECLSYCWPWQQDLSQQVNVAWTLGASQVWGPCWAFPAPAGFEGNTSFQGPEFPNFLPLSRAHSQCKSCCVPVPAPCTSWHLFPFWGRPQTPSQTGHCRPQSREGYCIKHFHTQGKPHGEDKARASIRMEKINSSHKSHTLENPISKEIRLVMIPCTQKWNEIPKLTCCTCFAFLSPRSGKTFLPACEKWLRPKQTLPALPSQSPAVAGSTRPGRLLQIPFCLTA